MKLQWSEHFNFEYKSFLTCIGVWTVVLSSLALSIYMYIIYIHIHNIYIHIHNIYTSIIYIYNIYVTHSYERGLKSLRPIWTPGKEVRAIKSLCPSLDCTTSTYQNFCIFEATGFIQVFMYTLHQDSSAPSLT